MEGNRFQKPAVIGKNECKCKGKSKLSDVTQFVIRMSVLLVVAIVTVKVIKALV